MTLLLPSVDAYDDWRDWARAVTTALDQAGITDAGQQQLTYYSITHIDPDSLPNPPEGYRRLWLSAADAKLFLENPAYDPPLAGDIVFIDTAAIADAAIKAGKIDTYAVIESKIANAGVGTTKIQSLAVTQALIALLGVGEAQIADLAVKTGKIGLAAIVTALIGDLQVTTGKVNDLAVNNGKIANLAVDSGKIANLSIGASHILDASITNAHIQDTIQSGSWNPATKAGWRLSKSGAFQGQSIEIYNMSGQLIFSAGGAPWGSALTGVPTNLSALSGSEGILNALVSMTSGGVLQNAGGGTLNLAHIAGLIDRASQTTGFGALAALSSLSYGSGQLLGFGTLAAISLLSTGNISTYIAGAAIGSALIANLAVGTGHINDLAVSEAKIQDLAVTSAKIAELIVDKISSGTLDAVIDVGTGMLKFTIGGNALYIGRGFGTGSQFIMWFGPSALAPAAATEAAATFFLKIDGSAYFGGSLTAGTLTNRVTSSSLSTTASTTTGTFGSNGGPRVVTVGYSYSRFGRRAGDQTASYTGSMGGTITLSGTASGSSAASGGVGGLNEYDPEFNRTTFRTQMSGSFTVTDNSGGLTASYTATLSGFSEIVFPGPPVGGADVVTQTLSIVSVEE